MPRIYTTRPGDMLDLICHREYGGRRAGALEAVLAANHATNLSDQPPELPVGLVIILPDLPSAPRGQATVNLWD